MNRSGSKSRRKVLLVHRYAGYPGPRTARAVHLHERLTECESEMWQGFEVARWPEDSFPARIGSAPNEGPAWRRRLGDLAQRVLIDRHEPKMRLGARSSLKTEGIVAALIVSLPASAASIASQRLREAGIPYVVDQGDPWGLGVDGASLAVRRRREAEIAMWQGAAGGVLTTQSQASRVLEVVPKLPVLIRMNGYHPVEHGWIEELFYSRKRPDDDLRLVYFGSFGDSLVSPDPLLKELAGSGYWSRVTLTHIGTNHESLRSALSPGVEVISREGLPWERARVIANRFDAAIVMGTRSENGTQVPSKAIEYLGLPIPRIAMSRSESDELFGIASSRPGFLAIRLGEPGIAERIHRHITTDWEVGDLLPPESDSWDEVKREVCDFFVAVTGIDHR